MIEVLLDFDAEARGSTGPEARLLAEAGFLQRS
jgi:hypothetical protein